VDVDANVQWMNSDYTFRTVLTNVYHPVESQQMGWEMMFSDYIIRKVYNVTP